MKREFLESLGLEKDVIDKVMEENGRDINAANSKVGAKEQEISLLNDKLSEANNTIKSYKDMDIEAIKASAGEWETKYKDSQKELVGIKNDYALRTELAKSGTIDIDVLASLIDRDSIRFKDDGIIGLDEQLKSIKQNKAYLFKETTEQREDSGYKSVEPPEGSSGEISSMEATLDSIFK